MSLNIRTPGATRSLGRVLGAAAVLAAPLAANADTTHHAYSAHHAWRHGTAEQKRETVEARIASLHSSLMITLDEEQDWAAVAQVMRANEATMEALVAKENARPPHSQTAVQDMRTYETFTAAHVTGLATLISSFEVLYAAMPAPQQAVADKVFQNFGHRA
jgi:hypothetical protein